MWKRTGEGLQAQTEGREGRISLGELCRTGRWRGTSCATLRSAEHSGGQKEKLRPKKRSLLSCAPQGQLLLEEAAESQGRQEEEPRFLPG